MRTQVHDEGYMITETIENGYSFVAVDMPEIRVDRMIG